jgi:hypothetical protein
MKTHDDGGFMRQLLALWLERYCWSGTVESRAVHPKTAGHRAEGERANRAADLACQLERF